MKLETIFDDWRGLHVVIINIIMHIFYAHYYAENFISPDGVWATPDKSRNRKFARGINDNVRRRQQRKQRQQQ